MDSISIIIATYNAEKYLERCLDSIITQIDFSIELIIIDGGSKDATLNIIRKNSQHISYWHTEPDKGIYDAWNKGLKVSKGSWIMFLGADDYFVPGALQLYKEFIRSRSDRLSEDFISAKVQVISEGGKLIRVWGSAFEWPLFLKGMMIAHPGALHSANLFRKYGNFNINYRIAGDYELLLRAGPELNALFMNNVTVVMNEGGVSDNVKGIYEQYTVVTESGRYPRHKALLNSSIVYLKFKFKKFARKFGLNIHFG